MRDLKCILFWRLNIFRRRLTYDDVLCLWAMSRGNKLLQSGHVELARVRMKKAPGRHGVSVTLSSSLRKANKVSFNLIRDFQEL
jgi:hypothetical protein